jgi:hypothetical protein
VSPRLSPASRARARSALVKNSLTKNSVTDNSAILFRSRNSMESYGYSAVGRTMHRMAREACHESTFSRRITRHADSDFAHAGQLGSSTRSAAKWVKYLYVAYNRTFHRVFGKLVSICCRLCGAKTATKIPFMTLQKSRGIFSNCLVLQRLDSD